MGKVAIDVDAVPREVCDDLARPLLAAVDAYFKRPGVEEEYQAWLVEYKKRKAGQTESQQTHR